MRTYRGIVCEKLTNHMIFLTQNGEFQKGIPLIANPEIGDEVDFYLETAVLPNRNKRNVYYKLGPALLAAILCIFIGTSLLLPNKSIAAYIQLNGDYPMEIGVDENGKVISVEAHFEEPLPFKELEGLSIDAALDEVLGKIFSKDQTISITAEYKNENLPKLKKQVEKAVKQIRENQSETNSNSKENPSNQKSIMNNGESTEIKEEIQHPPSTQEQPKKNVEHKPAEPNNQTTDQNLNEKQEVPKQSQKQVKTNPSTEKSKSDKQEIKNEQPSTKGNNNQNTSNRGNSFNSNKTNESQFK